MQVTLKTLQQQTFKIDIDPEETVRAAGRGEARARVGGGAGGTPQGGVRSPRALWAGDREGLEADGVEQHRPAWTLEAAARSAWSWGRRGRGGLAAWALEPGLKCTHRWGRAIQASPPPSHDLVGCGDLGAGWLPKVMAFSVPGFVCTKERWWGENEFLAS